MAESLNGLGAIRFRAEDHDQAAALFARALETAAAELGPYDPNTITALLGLCAVKLKGRRAR